MKFDNNNTKHNEKSKSGLFDNFKLPSTNHERQHRKKITRRKKRLIRKIVIILLLFLLTFIVIRVIFAII